MTDVNSSISLQENTLYIHTMKVCSYEPDNNIESRLTHVVIKPRPS